MQRHCYILAAQTLNRKPKGSVNLQNNFRLVANPKEDDVRVGKKQPSEFVFQVDPCSRCIALRRNNSCCLLIAHI